MMSLFSPSSVVGQTSDAASTVPLSVVRQVFQEFSEARAANLALRQAVADHETANTKSSPVPKALLNASGGRGGGRGRGGTRQPTNQGDLRTKPPTSRIPSSVPRNIPSMIVWDVVKYDTAIAVSSSAITETNFSFSLSSHPQSSSWIALFDQWCIPQASVTFRTEMAPGTTQSVPILYSALDFDSLGNLGSVTSIEDFASCVVTSMPPGKSMTRSVKPCLKVSVQTGGANSNGGVQRCWIDSGSSGTQLFGIRSIVSSTSASGFNIIATVTVWFAFRSQI